MNKELEGILRDVDTACVFDYEGDMGDMDTWASVSNLQDAVAALIRYIAKKEAEAQGDGK